MATDFAPTFEKKFHDKVVPGLLMVLDDNANPRVQAHAGPFSFFEHVSLKCISVRFVEVTRFFSIASLFYDGNLQLIQAICHLVEWLKYCPFNFLPLLLMHRQLYTWEIVIIGRSGY
jgi:hypothetical protein